MLTHTMSFAYHRLFVAMVFAPALLYGAAALLTTNARAAQSQVAVVLPLNAPAFGRHADAVRQGVAAAVKAAGNTAPQVRVYTASEDPLSVLAVYEQAVKAGAQLIIGPLTRNGVSALAASNLVSVPTLALNLLDASAVRPPRLYLFGLSLEHEARLVARLAFDAGQRNAFVISDDSSLSKRIRDAFVDELAHLGGNAIADLTYGAEPATLSRLRQATNLGVADMAFLALDHGRAVIVRPYLAHTLAVYATSQINAGKGPLAARELNQVRFVDMPWLLQTDHPAVMVYPRAQLGDTADLERLYALGIDAFRLGLELLHSNRNLPLDGVTGRIRLEREHLFVRELTAAQFIDGKIVIIGETR